MMLQRGRSLVYSNVRLIRADRLWRCIGPTHEYWSLDNCKKSDLDTLTIDDRGDGGSKDDKFERDISLLTKVLEQEPDNERHMFYLAESYRNSKQYRSAIDWYRKRIERGRWQEETWYARYMVGACHEALEELPEATVAYLNAYTDRGASPRPRR
jgi:tetratricopeptide (TPR) repeat protein